MSEEQKGSIIIYQSSDGINKIDVRLEDENVWLSQQQMAELYQTSRTNVVGHIKNIYKEDELDKNSTCQNFRQVRLEGNRNVQREIPFYNLDNLVSAYFDLAELSAIEEREMRMAYYVQELDTILSSAGRKLLENAGRVSTGKAKDRAKFEYKKYKAKTLDSAEEEYLKTISSLEKQAKMGSKNNRGKS